MKQRTLLFLVVLFTSLRLASLEKSLFSYVSEISFSGSFEKLFETCLRIPNNLCLGGTSTVVTSDSVQNGLIAKWTFDDIYALDYSANNNHIHKFVRPAPGFNGHGYSGAFLGDNSGFVHASDILKTTEFTIVFWIYLLERSTNNFRNILSQIHQGEEKIAVLLHPHMNRISVRIIEDANSNEGLSSMGQIAIRRWTNVGIKLSEDRIELYLNGVLDNSVYIKNKIIEKEGDITIGKSINYSSFNGYLDEIYFFSRSLSKSELISFAFSNLTGIHDTDFVYVGNYECNYATAMSSNLCKKKYHLCSSFDLYNGAIHYARVNGILSSQSNLWPSDISENSIESGEKRIALCCKVYEVDTRV
ncbi:hypothetical protein, conserved [Plasmodium gonderi]|uniref:DUF8019 domain-containing protein n=1 Tax=Plasmodium gonderi TaxID=77519 RepID=A0A1Y1JA37_PLAGO|nr:hypothetical protein, conserved [Plasmodium gonderi]GAW79371.1 hypothetical protein, conserved [Plasmodium gonderi]